MADSPVQEIEPSAAFLLAGILYLPHYHQANIFVGPGGREFTTDYLRIFGAQKHTILLWPRHYSS